MMSAQTFYIGDSNIRRFDEYSEKMGLDHTGLSFPGLPTDKFVPFVKSFPLPIYSEAIITSLSISLNKKIFDETSEFEFFRQFYKRLIPLCGFLIHLTARPNTIMTKEIVEKRNEKLSLFLRATFKDHVIILQSIDYNSDAVKKWKGSLIHFLKPEMKIIVGKIDQVLKEGAIQNIKMNYAQRKTYRKKAIDINKIHDQKVKKNFETNLCRKTINLYKTNEKAKWIVNF